MAQAIYILGSGGFAKEVYFLIKEIGNFDFKGFIDLEEKEKITFEEGEFRVFSEKEFLRDENPQTTHLAIGVGNPILIHKLSSKFKDFRFPNLIHPTAIMDRQNVKFGIGNIITTNVVFTTCIKVGSMNIFNLSSTIGHDVKIGNYNVINPTVNISGGVEIGDTNLFGVASTILQFKKIGNNCIIGASSLVTKDVADKETVVGIPAKSFKNNSSSNER